jgi:hypothetical protein
MILQQMEFGVDKVVCTSGNQTLSYSNTIYNSGIHGIELDGNFFIISNNIIYDTGMTAAGASGIHLYGGGYQGTPPDGKGNYNLVLNNVVYHAHEHLYHDGNGIQLTSIHTTIKYITILSSATMEWALLCVILEITSCTAIRFLRMS